MRIENVRETIVAVFSRGQDENIYTFLGTGAFFRPKNLLVTANHIVKNSRGTFAISSSRFPNSWLPAKLVRRDPDADLAIMEVPGYSPKSALELADESEMRPNVNVFCVEYSTTRKSDDTVYLNPAHRMGNVTRLVNLTELYGKAGEDALELSFPALRGASGAPVISNETLRVWGIIMANVSHELLPCQIERVVDEDGRITEETRFLLPQALAVNVKHLRSMLDGGLAK